MGAKYSLTTGSRALVVDDRPDPESKGDVIVLPVTYGLHKWDRTHPEYELEKTGGCTLRLAQDGVTYGPIN